MTQTAVSMQNLLYHGYPRSQQYPSWLYTWPSQYQTLTLTVTLTAMYNTCTLNLSTVWLVTHLCKVWHYFSRVVRVSLMYSQLGYVLCCCV